MEHKDLLLYKEFHQRIASPSMQKILNEAVYQSDVKGIPLIPIQVAALLFTLVRTASPERILELGTGIGYSALLLALASSDADIFTVEYDVACIKTAQKYINDFEDNSRITLVPGHALQVLASLSGNFDFVFLDAAKEEYSAYLKLLLPKLSAVAMIIADDIFFNGEMPTHTLPETSRKKIIDELESFRHYLREQPFFITSFLPIACGVSVTLLTKTPELFHNSTG